MVAVLVDNFEATSRAAHRPQLRLVTAATASPRWSESSASPAPRVGVSDSVFMWRRIAVAAAALLSLVVFWIGLQGALSSAGGGPLAATGAAGAIVPAGTQVWIVKPGDTLWSIATTIDPHGDVRPLVDRLSSEVNGASLYPGEQIAVP